MKRKSRKKYRHDMIQAWINQKNNRWVEESFSVTYHNSGEKIG